MDKRLSQQRQEAIQHFERLKKEFGELVGHFYVVTLQYKKDYFDNPNHPLIHISFHHSKGERTLEQLQELRPHCKITNVEELR